jgi:hypothetical protein
MATSIRTLKSLPTTPRVPAGILRQRQFIARLLATRRVSIGLTPIARVLRRVQQMQSSHTALSINVLMRLGQRTVSLQGELRNERERREVLHTEHTKTVERIIARQRLLEQRVLESRISRVAGVAERPALRERIERQTIFERVPMALAPHSSTVAAKSEAVTRESRSDRVMPELGNVVPLTAAERLPASLPVQELARVTDHVIKQLDRRVLSFHERMGRI